MQQACIREPLEEIGIHILPSQVHKLNRKVRGKLLSENFVVEQDFDTADAVLQTEEVSQIKWVSVSQLKQMAGHREFYRYPEFFDVVRFFGRTAKKKREQIQSPATKSKTGRKKIEEEYFYDSHYTQRRKRKGI